MIDRIRHHEIPANGDLREFLSQLELTPEKINYLLEHGAIYRNGVRQREDAPVYAGDILRIHLEPKKFLNPGAEWIPEVLYQDDDLMVIDKPSGLPTHPTLDNFIENAKTLGERFFKYQLFVTHRLDIPTSGVLLMTKNLAAQKGINKLFAKRKLEKVYRAQVENAVNEGSYVHYLNPESKIPKEVSLESKQGWLEARMQVRHLDSTGKNLEIILETGRTHQIRAQLSALGSPIVGDRTYGAQSPLGPQDFKIRPGADRAGVRSPLLHLPLKDSQYLRFPRVFHYLDQSIESSPAGNEPDQ